MVAEAVRCIFCKADSGGSTSVEHIIPESLGNEAHTLPPGVVCDRCNNYFGLKIEKPLLDSGTFRFLRGAMRIPSKKGRVPRVPNPDDRRLPEYRLTARFIGKVGLEALARTFLRVDGWNDEIVDKEELDALRAFVRFGRGQEWPFCFRPIYPMNAVFHDGKEYYEVLHEYDLLYTLNMQMYVVLAILGVEFAMNLAEPELRGYFEWLAQHDYASPLYTDFREEWQPIG